MGVQKQKLTEWPDDLKDVIDWLAAVGGGFGTTRLGTGKYSELGKRLEELQGFTTAAQNTLPISNYEGIIKKLAEGLGYGFLGYANQGGSSFSGEGVIKKDGGYKSTYENAQWPGGADEQKQCAIIFLGSAYVTYYFVTFLYWACSVLHGGPWKTQMLDGSLGTGGMLKKYLQNMGFNIDVLVGDKWSYTVANDLESDFNGFAELKVSGPSYYSSYNYSQYLEKLNQKHKHVDWNQPIIGCYRLANCYFNQNKTSLVTQAMEKIKTEFESFRGTRVHTYETLKTNIKSFLESVTTFTPTPSPLPPQQPPSDSSTTSFSQSSPAGAVAGTLTTLGLGGGAAAAYLLNLGGAKTLINSLLRIG
ncbi:variant erythrocyte surface antigen-1, alpha subunit [Babesia caballi]|uniref:Variant erythrocyte surface antigen-1, alpha subunit n=1 Tax=Babesia caballi TaxID=5871 RepID=A0AAV4LNN4_BABCB|nr:variant erythrocyte surface antigen-1, alpha subunit [Babesia caballi]